MMVKYANNLLHVRPLLFSPVSRGDDLNIIPNKLFCDLNGCAGVVRRCSSRP